MFKNQIKRCEPTFLKCTKRNHKTNWHSVVHSLSWLWPETFKTVSKREPWHRSHLLVGQTFNYDSKSVSRTVLLWNKGSSFSMNLGFSEATPRFTFRKTPRAGALPLPWNILIFKNKNTEYGSEFTMSQQNHLVLMVERGNTDRRTQGEDAWIPLKYHLNKAFQLKPDEFRQRLLKPIDNPNGVKDKITIHSC